MANRQQNLFL